MAGSPDGTGTRDDTPRSQAPQSGGGIRYELLAIPLTIVGLLSFLAPVVGLVALLVLAVGGVAVLIRAQLRDREEGEGVVAAAFSGLPLALLIGIAAGIAPFVPILGIVLLTGLVLTTLFRFGRLQATSLILVYIASLILISSKYTVGPFSITGGGAIAAVLGLMWGTAKILPSANISRGWNQAIGGLFAYGFVTLIAFAIAASQQLTVVQQKNANRLLSIAFLAIMGALAIADFVHRRGMLRRLLGVWIGSATVVGIIAILQYTINFDIAEYLAPPGLTPKGDPTFIQSREGLTRVGGTFQHPIEFSVITGATLPLAMHFARFGRTDLSRSAARFSVVVLALALPTAVSRSGIIALGIAVAVSALVWPIGRIAKAGLIAGLLAVMSTLLFPGLLETIGGLFTDQENASTIGRQERVDYAFELAETDLIVGRGLGWYVPGEHPDIGVLDNFWADQLVNQGLLGIVGMIGMVVLGFMEARRISTRRQDAVDQDLAMTLSGMAFGIATAGWGLSFYYYPMTMGLLFALLGCLAALGRIVDRDAADDERLAGEVRSSDTLLAT